MNHLKAHLCAYILLLSAVCPVAAFGAGSSSIPEPSAYTAPADSLLLSGFESEAEWSLDGRRRTVPFTMESRPDRVKAGKFSAKWNDLAYNEWTRLAKVPPDWSGYEAVSLWIYAEKANGQQINFVVESPSPEEKAGYCLYRLKVDWTGWRQVVMPFSAFAVPRKIAGWSKVSGFRITAGGWDAEPLPDTVLYLDDLRLIRR